LFVATIAYLAITSKHSRFFLVLSSASQQGLRLNPAFFTVQATTAVTQVRKRRLTVTVKDYATVLGAPLPTLFGLDFGGSSGGVGGGEGLAVRGASALVAFICILCTPRTQISRSICNFTPYRCV
jgi:hypothetical protein